MSATTNAHIDLGSSLVPSRTGRHWSGFGNLLRKELGQWWSTKMWWIQLLIWVGLIDGISLIMAMNPEGMTPDEHFLETVKSPFLVGAVVVSIGVVLTLQGTIIGERDQGTAAWVMSKPVSRSSFVISKIAAHSFGFLVTAVLVPTALFVGIAVARFPGRLDYGDYAVAVSVLALSTVFYVALTVCLGTLFTGRGPVAGIAIAFILTGQFFSGMLPSWLVFRTPWTLGNVAASFAAAAPSDWSRTTPVIATAVATLALSAIAVWRFGRDEF